MEKELEELDKTTDILKAFKSRVGEEDKTEDIEKLMSEWRNSKKKNDNKISIKPDYSEEKMVEPVYEDLDKIESIQLSKVTGKSRMDLGNLDDDHTLELSDIEYDKTIKLDEELKFDDDIKEDEQIAALVNNKKDDVEERLNASLELRRKQKRYGIRLAVISFIFLPLLITLIVIGTHSNELVTKDIMSILSIITGLISALFVVGIIFYLKNIKIDIESKTNKIIKYMYIFLMTIYTTICVTLLVLLYGPINEFRDWLVSTSMGTSEHQYYCTWFYNDDEITESLNRSGNIDTQMVDNEA